MIIDGEQLIITIALNKKRNRDEAIKAFKLFCSHYEADALKMALALCEYWKKGEGVAYDIVQCAFEKIWKYPTFDISKSKVKDKDRAIKSWINGILLRELSMFSKKGYCSNPEEEDLPLITSMTAFINEKFKDVYLSDDDFLRMKVELEKLLSGLNQKELTIYLTYKLYQKDNLSMPRSVLKKLRAHLNMHQDAIRQCHCRVKQEIEKL